MATTDIETGESHLEPRPMWCEMLEHWNRSSRVRVSDPDVAMLNGMILAFRGDSPLTHRLALAFGSADLNQSASRLMEVRWFGSIVAIPASTNRPRKVCAIAA